MLHPHDEALLYDLLDGRLAPAAAEEVRRRVEDEPELRAAWDDLARIRAHLRALPTTSVPDSFSASVLARAGLPPTVVAGNGALHGSGTGPQASAPEGASANPSLGAAPVVGTNREAPILRMRRFMMPAAAVLGVALGAGMYFALEGEKAAVRSKDQAIRADSTASPYSFGAPESAPPSSPSSTPAGRAGAAPESKITGALRGENESRPAPSGGAGPFGAPGGAVPAGLRGPSDAPVRATPPPPAGASAPAPTPAPVPPPAPAPTAGPEAEPAPDERAAPGYGSPPPVEPPSEAHEERAAEEKGAQPDALRRAEDARRAATAMQTWAVEGVDDVLVLQADSLDAARAEIALLGNVADPAALARLRPRLRRLEVGCVIAKLDDTTLLDQERDKADQAKEGERRFAGKDEAPGMPGMTEEEKSGLRWKAPAPVVPNAEPVVPSAKPAGPDGRLAAPAEGSPADADRDRAAGDEALAHPLGSLRIDLGAEAWSKLEAALRPELSATCKETSVDEEAAKDAKDGAAAMGTEGKPEDAARKKRPSPNRRLRILVVAR